MTVGRGIHCRKPVAPYTGAWIEIAISMYFIMTSFVAPYTGAWIEIASPALRRRAGNVAPYTGAWIEIGSVTRPSRSVDSRSLHGSVD